MGGLLYFVASNDATGEELWRSDGSQAGTYLVKDVNPGKESPSITYLAVVGNTLFFSARQIDSGVELWKSDGSEADTLMVKDIFPEASNSGPLGLADFNGTLFFSADDGVHGRELWQSDGTPDGTVMIMDINYTLARDLYQRGLEICRREGYPYGVSAALTNLSIVMRKPGDFEGARKLVEESLSLKRETGNRIAILHSLLEYEALNIEMGDYTAADHHFGEALQLALAMQS